jgi:hypothetical protein
MNMERRDFLKNAGMAGMCACVVGRIFASDSNTPKAPEDWRIAFARSRYSHLIKQLEARLAPEAFEEVLLEMGQFCSDAGFAKNFAGKLDEYLSEMERRWGATTTFDRQKQVVQFAFRPEHADCACPLMGKGLVPASACHCSLGAIRRSFTVVAQHPVQVKLLGSVLQGDDACRFAVELKPS